MNPTTLQRLETVPVFQAIGTAGLERIAAQLRWQSWSRQQAVMAPDETLHWYYIVIAGRVKISVQHPDNGRELSLQLLRAGDGHDLIPLLSGEPNHVQATTLDPVEAVSAPLSSWRQWLSDYPALRRFLLRYAAARLQELSRLAEDLALHDTSTRLAHLLLRYVDDIGTSDDHPLSDLVHEEIAQLIGTVREVVNRLLNRFRREGIIQTTGGSLRISDLERLLEKAEARYANRLEKRRRGNPPPSDI